MRPAKASAARLALAAAVVAVLLATLAPAALAVTATALPPGAVEGTGFASTVATFTDGFGVLTCTPTARYTARITWGDGTTTAGSVSGGVGTLLGPCLYAVDGGHVYAEEGRVNYAVSITGPAGSGDTGPTPLAVHDAPLAASATGFTASQNTLAAATLATFTDNNPGAVPSDFSATVAWGDGTSGAGTVAAAPAGGFAVTATHTYAHRGSFTASVAVGDAGGSQASASATATVLAGGADQPPGATRPGPSAAPAPLRLGLSTPVLARGGTVVVGVRCPVAARLCRGRLAVATIASPHSRLAGLRSAQTIGATLFIIPGGRRAELSVRPKRTLVALLRRAGTVKVAAYASSFDAATGRGQVASLTAKLRLARQG